MSDFREALRELASKIWEHGYDTGVGGNAIPDESPHQFERFLIDEIATRHGPFFSEREVWGMLKDVYKAGSRKGRCRVEGCPMCEDLMSEEIHKILSRHTEGDEKLDKKSAQVFDENYDDLVIKGDDTPAIKASEIEALQKQVAALTERVLADGHARDCPLFPGRGGYPVKCTCYHDQIHKPDPGSRV